jgi:NADH-quinone oxidoreductase subunit J
MSLVLLAQEAGLPGGADTGLGEGIAFWILGPVALAGALGMVFARNAVHSALCLAGTMLSLGLLYMAQGAMFLGFVQIIVYTGAVMMLFLFVLMLVGVDASDSLVETLRGQRLLAVVVGVGLGLLLALGAAQAVVAPVVGLTEANAQGNVPALAGLLFNKYVWAFEVTSALLITAALGAMVLSHRERLVPKITQRERAQQRMRDYAAHGSHLGPLPAPGVYARHNAVDTPALLPDGTASDLSVSRSLKARGAIRSAPLFADDIDDALRSIDPAHGGTGPSPNEGKSFPGTGAEPDPGADTIGDMGDTHGR